MAGYSPASNNNNNSYSNNGYSSNSLPRNGVMTQQPLSSPPTSDLDDRGRSKKRNFFGTLKKRLSRSKTRTHSADQQQQHHQSNQTTTPTGTLNGDSRSLSVDRAVLSKSNSLGNYLCSTPSPKENTHPPTHCHLHSPPPSPSFYCRMRHHVFVYFFHPSLFITSLAV